MSCPRVDHTLSGPLCEPCLRYWKRRLQAVVSSRYSSVQMDGWAIVIASRASVYWRADPSWLMWSDLARKQVLRSFQSSSEGSRAAHRVTREQIPRRTKES